MRNIILTLLFSIILQYFFLTTIHDHAKSTYDLTFLVLYSILFVSIYIFYKLKVKIVAAIIILFIGFFVTFLTNFSQLYLKIINPKYIAIDSAFIIDKNNKLDYKKVHGDFYYEYIYGIDLIKSKDLKNAKIESNKFLFWETAYLSGYKPVLIDNYKESIGFIDKSLQFFTILLKSFIEMLFKSLFSNFLILFFVVKYFIKREL